MEIERQTLRAETVTDNCDLGAIFYTPPAQRYLLETTQEPRKSRYYMSKQHISPERTTVLWMRSFHKHLNKSQTGRPHTLKVGGDAAALQHRAFLHMQMWCRRERHAKLQPGGERGIRAEPSPAGPPPSQTSAHVHLVLLLFCFLLFCCSAFGFQLEGG